MGIWAALAAQGDWLRLAMLLVVGWMLLTLSLVDSATLRLPDVLTLPLILLGVLAGLLWSPDSWERAVGAAAGYGALAFVSWSYSRLRGRDGLGLGDAKLLAGAGAWLGWAALPWVLLLACLLAIAGLMTLRLLRGREVLSQPLPFGPPIALALWITLLHGRPV